MRVKILIASSLLMLALITMKCPAPNWNNPGVQSADELISGGKGVVISDLTSQAQASRAAQMGESGKDILNQASGSALSSGASTPQEARSQDLSETSETQSNATDETAPLETVTSTQPAAIFGSWSLELNDNEPHLANLTIFQDEDAVYGTGTIKLDAGSVVTATASGTITDQELSLDLVSVEKVSLYRISMTVSGDSAIGNYVAFSPGEASITGNAKGVRAAPSS
jgi:hypothetical protein